MRIERSVAGRQSRIDALAAANVALVVAIALHATDHVRQARGLGALTPEVLWGGVVLAVAAFATLLLTLRRHPRAPTAAVVVGLATAAGVSASHLAPHWSALSDPYADAALGPYSWAVMLAEIAAALVLAFVAAGRLADARLPERATTRTG
jgi:4-amino-4-deoxy-L-arabinose transferase-like glycosyltransferase